MARHYFINGLSTASAEDKDIAERLERRGYTRVTCAAWRQARRANEERDVERLALEDWLEKQNTPVESAPLGAVMKTKI